MSKIACIVAYAKNRVIGVNNQLPWQLKADLQFFKQTTMGCPIIMGRKTWDSLGRPLPGRRNIVISRNPNWQADSAEHASSLAEALTMTQDCPQVFIIGGEQIFKQALDVADTIYATEIDLTPDGDAFFPPLSDEWKKVSEQVQEPENNIHFSFVRYEKS
ncbi:dihydrofolate reductase [Basilea psittacipulmonis]|uniref:Dihydrofolate reductase n=1 Tax=Basilea psittacipulmonis DSM 24701 TaxID=1072685 RepID=A0A077DCX9_9BURK|nr:dihydrofolate reductase [Basilea psittacipulmonis]AIL32464.1 hypothetical protein IX83_03320 [Basilea psittacipulmonis DSM 24701]